MNCVAQVHKESIGLPEEPRHDVIIREFLPVKQICCCYANGVCGPQLQILVTLLQFQGNTGCFAQECIDQCVRDESDLKDKYLQITA